ncbi:MAG: hypothetical protein M1816_003731 [Peltula sp. TS41687]|nr:MAG: hypothetical protein M1816_003731 [Peltula sp. TS41687]
MPRRHFQRPSIRALISPKPLPSPRLRHPFNTRAAGLRTNQQSTPTPQIPSPSPPPPPPPPPRKSQARIDRLTKRLPSYLQRYLTPLRTKPLTHITSFLILHELTAIIPLFGLAAAFHYSNWLPPGFTEGKWAAESVKKMDRWLRKRGWIGNADDDNNKPRRKRWWNRWGKGHDGVRWAVELGAAWAVTKALLPVRILVSLWLTPAFARGVVGPVWRGLGKPPRAARGASSAQLGVDPRESQGVRLPQLSCEQPDDPPSRFFA